MTTMGLVEIFDEQETETQLGRICYLCVGKFGQHQILPDYYWAEYGAPIYCCADPG